ncbi:YwmB family TATA-box binding protein [Clostridium sp. ZS2-4]|uniref:YwmB family TATA-box binding protein n=1 Tax=Clostridium sp. ZS2-4 TaxID=2987703 RepID=UPI00227C3E4C|nr:YwmB family TATA-box binding protein [Clostridium sp. ZS2-4]MCY6355476.1 YwmB family TATA-box binding protein [Clostridium sp. ZS2-4]
MEKNRKVIILVFIMFAMLLNYKISYAYKGIDLFTSILNETKGEVVEYGLKTRFKTYKNGQESYNYFLNIINSKKLNYRVKVSKDKDNYCIEFEDKSSKGYMEFFTSEEGNVISIEIIKKDSENNLLKLKDDIKGITSFWSDNEVSYFQYLKAKLPNDALDDINKKINFLLKSEGASNLHSIKINNGFSTSAYTYRYKAIKSNGKLIDFNFALCKYKSGKYVIIGTPEIVVSY